MRLKTSSKLFSRRYLVLFGGLVLLLLFAGVSFILYATMKVQQALLSDVPIYAATDLYNKALEQVEKEDYKAAEGYLEQALMKEEDSTYRNKLAVVKYRLKKYPEAIEQYQKLIDQKKDVAFAWNGIGNAYRDWATQDNFEQYREKSIAAYEEAIKADPRYVAAYSNLALLYINQNKPDETKRVLAEGIQVTKSLELISIQKSLFP